MKIRVPRPEDPELAQLWDEAKQAVEARSGADIVAAIARDDTCCLSDRSRCRCQPQGGWSAEDETGGDQ